MDLSNNLINSTTVTSTTNPPKRIRLESDDWFEKASRSRLLESWKEQETYVDYLESLVHQLQQSSDSNERVREKEIECKKLKSMLNYRFLTKTTQQQSLVEFRMMSMSIIVYSLFFSFLFQDQIREMMQTPPLARLRQTYLDPSINLIYGQMRDEIEHTRKARDDAQSDLQSREFTPDR